MKCQSGLQFYNFKKKRCEKCKMCEDGTYTDTKAQNNNINDQSDPGPQSQSESDSEDSIASKKRKRDFRTPWLKTYSWLRYDKGGKLMYCQLCTEHGKTNGLSYDAKCTNYQNTTLIRHALHSEHKLLVEASVMKNDMKKAVSASNSKVDKACMVLMKSVHWLACENIPVTKFKSLLNFMDDLQLADTQILKNGCINYNSPSTANDIMQSLACCVENDLVNALQNSQFITVIADESTDITNHKRLVIYVQIIEGLMSPTTHFLTNVEVTDTTGKGIAKAIFAEFQKREIPISKIFCLGSDGASVMTGKVNGVAAIMHRENPHMSNIHCIAHKLALCTSQAANNIQCLKDHQQVLTDLFYYFKGSSKRELRLHQIQEVLQEPYLKYKEIHSVRWLSYHMALSNVFLTLDSLLGYLLEVGSQQFISLTYMMMDAMAPVTKLSQFFQKENVDIALVKSYLQISGAHGAEKCYKCVACPHGKYSNSMTTNGYKKMCVSWSDCSSSHRYFSVQPNSTQGGKCGKCLPCTFPYVPVLLDSICENCTLSTMNKPECSSCNIKTISSKVQPFNMPSTINTSVLAAVGLGSALGLILLSLFIYKGHQKCKKTRTSQPASAFSSTTSTHSCVKSSLLVADNIDRLKALFEELSKEKQQEIFEKKTFIFVSQRINGVSKKEFFRSLFPKRSDLVETCNLDIIENRYILYSKWVELKTPTNRDMFNVLLNAYEQFKENIYEEVLECVIDCIKNDTRRENTSNCSYNTCNENVTNL